MASPQSRTATSLDDQVQSALHWLERHATKHTLDGMARYGLPKDNALGVSIADIQVLAKTIGRNHELALALWKTGGYEARLLTSFIDEPERVTPAQMERWCRDFDNWGICDTVCFQLFDRTPHALAKIEEWRIRKPEFEKRAAFALLASLAGHDKTIGDEPFLRSLRWIEEAATDERNFVKKGVLWALRRVGGRSPALRAQAVPLARRLRESANAAARWIGKEALKDFDRPQKSAGQKSVAKKPAAKKTVAPTAAKRKAGAKK